MDAIEASVKVYRPPEEVFDFLHQFSTYPDYSEYVEDVRVAGDPEPGRRFSIAFSWWRLEYRARGRVTDVSRPERIEFTITKDLDAHGHWDVSPAELSADAPDDAEAASRARLRIAFDADTADEDALRLPPMVSIDRVIGKLVPFVQREGARIARRVVEDLEGRRRPIELRVHDLPDVA